MTEAVSEITSVVEELSERMRALESRVSALEGQPRTQAPAQPSLTAAVTSSRPPETWQRFPPLENPWIVPTLGKAILGIAGAYFLRAIAESGSVPKLPVLILAVAYAASWMVLAVRVHANQFASVTYGITSILILSPMLWESTVRFQFLSPACTGTILVGFFVLTLALAWQRNLEAIPWLAAVATTVTALALMLATHELVLLTVPILAVALVVEMAACFGHFVTLRVVPALTADIAVWLVVYLMTSSTGVPEGYRPTAPATLTALWFVLIATYVGSVGIRGFWLRRHITLIDVGQGTLAFMVAYFGATRASHGSISAALGIYFLILAAGCYWGALSRFAEQSYAGNRRVSAAWAAILLIGGSSMLFPAGIQVIFLCLAAVAATFVYTRTTKLSLGLHASLFLAVAATLSSLPSYAVNALARVVPSAPDWGVVITAGSAALCYAVGTRMPESNNRRRALWIFPAALAAVTVAVLAVVAIVWIADGRGELSASHLSVVRTIVICVLALALGFLRLRWRRIELGWVAYAAVALGTLKLLFEDLRFGNAASLVISLLFYGLVLVGLPRLTRRGRAASKDYAVAP
jgi:hypothetical protein